MGNPAMVRRKKSEKRRKKYEQRLGPGAYLPKDERLKVNAEVEKLEAEEKARKAQLARERKAKQAEKAKAKPAAPAKAEKPADEKAKK